MALAVGRGWRCGRCGAGAGWAGTAAGTASTALAGLGLGAGKACWAAARTCTATAWAAAGTAGAAAAAATGSAGGRGIICVPAVAVRCGGTTGEVWVAMSAAAGWR